MRKRRKSFLRRSKKKMKNFRYYWKSRNLMMIGRQIPRMNLRRKSYCKMKRRRMLILMRRKRRMTLTRKRRTEIERRNC